jgi:DNA-binding transcriptional regulator YiaG
VAPAPAPAPEPATITIPQDEYIDLLRSKNRLLEGKSGKPRRPTRPLLPAEIAEIRRLAALGVSQSEIARRLQRSSAVVSLLLRETGHA